MILLKPNKLLISSIEIDFSLLLSEASLNGWSSHTLISYVQNILNNYEKQKYINKYTILRVTNSSIEVTIYCPYKKVINVSI